MRGSLLPTACNVVQNLGWATFELFVIATAATAISERVFGVGGRPLWVLAFGVLATVMAVAGPLTVLRRWQRAVWAVLASTVYLAWYALTRFDLAALADRPTRAGSRSGPGSTWPSPCPSPGCRWSPTTPASAARPGSTFWGTAVGYFLAQVWFFALGILFLLSIGQGDVIAALLAVPVGLLALAVLVVDETDEVFANLYSAGVSLKNAAPRLPGRRVAVALGAVATWPRCWSTTWPATRTSCSCSGRCSCPCSRCWRPTGTVLARRRYDVEAMYRADGPYRGALAGGAGLAAGVPGLQLDQPGDGDGLGVAGRGPVRHLLGLPSRSRPGCPGSAPPSPRSLSPSWLCWRSVAAPGGDLRMTTTVREDAGRGPGVPGGPGGAQHQGVLRRQQGRVQGAQVQAPFAALVEAAAARLRRSVPGIGQPKVFRIYRDLRFSKDKTPYKTSMSASMPSRPAEEEDGPGVGTGFYVNVGPAGLYTASGLYHPGRPELERVRAAVADPACGPELEAVLARAAGKGWSRTSTPSSACPGPGRPRPRGPTCSGPLPGPQPPARPRPGCRPPSCSTASSPTGRRWSPSTAGSSGSPEGPRLRQGGGRRTPAGRPGRGRGS